MPSSRLRPNPVELTTARVRLGLTLRKAAQAAQCSHVHLSALERGKSGVGADLLKRLADLYGVPVESLYTLVATDAA